MRFISDLSKACVDRLVLPRYLIPASAARTAGAWPRESQQLPSGPRGSRLGSHLQGLARVLWPRSSSEDLGANPCCLAGPFPPLVIPAYLASPCQASRGDPEPVERSLITVTLDPGRPSTGVRGLWCRDASAKSGQLSKEASGCWSNMIIVATLLWGKTASFVKS